MTVTPGPLVPESVGFVQACVMLNNEPTGDILITLQTVGGNAQGTLFFICKITMIHWSMNWVFIVFCLKFTAGSDYDSLTQELTFTASPILTQCANITIIQDGAVENSAEFFAVQATASSSIITGLPVSRIIIIRDVDRKSQHTQ